jgi:uncharacterized protein (DUF305 family)
MIAPFAETSGVFAPRLTSPALVVVAAAALCACSSPPTSPPAPAPATSNVAFSFGGTDRAWIEINIAMAEELAPLLELVPAHSRDAAVQALGAQVKGLNDQELGTLRRLHSDAQLPAENPHEGMAMPGMMTPELLARAKELDGPAFDKFLKERLREHMRQGVSLAQSETRAGVEPRSKALATDMIAKRNELLSKALK